MTSSAANTAELRAEALSPLETLAQSIASITAPISPKKMSNPHIPGLFRTALPALALYTGLSGDSTAIPVLLGCGELVLAAGLVILLAKHVECVDIVSMQRADRGVGLYRRV